VSTFGIFKEACRILLEASPEGISLKELTSNFKALPGIQDVHDLHV